MSAIEDLLKAEQAGTLDPEGAQLLGEARRRGMAPAGRVTGLGMGKAVASGAVAGAVAPLGLPGDVRDVAEAGWRKTTDWLGQAAGAVRDFALDDPKDPERKVRPPVQIPPVVGQVAAAVQRPGGLPAAVLEAVLGRRMPGGRGAAEAVGADYAPRNAFERYLQKGAAGAGSAAWPVAGIAPSARVAMGTSGGLVGEAGRTAMQPTGPYGEMLGEVAGNVVGGFPVSVLTARTPQLVKSLQDFARDVTPGEVGRANTTRRLAGHELGVDTLLSQGFDRPTALSAVTEEVAKSRHGSRIRNILTTQQRVGKQRAEQFVDDAPGPGIELGTPGENFLGRTAKRVMVDEPNDTIRMLTRSLWERAANEYVPGEKLKTLPGIIRDITREKNIADTTDAAEEIKRIVGKVEGPGGIVEWSKGRRIETPMDPPGPEPVTMIEVIPPRVKAQNAVKVDSITKEVANDLNAIDKPAFASSRKPPPSAVVSMTPAKTRLDAMARESSPALDEVKELTKVLDRRYRDPIEKGALPKVFGNEVTLAAEWPKADLNKVKQIFRDHEKFSPRDVAEIGQRLNAADPKAFRTVVKAHLEERLREANSSSGGRFTPEFLDNFPESIAGTLKSNGQPDAQRANFREMMRQLVVPGRNAGEFAEGAERLMDSLRVIAREQKAAAKIDTTEMAQRAGETTMSTLLRTHFVQPGYQMARVLERWVHGNTYKRAVDILVDPEKADDIIALARYSPADVRLRLAAQQLLGIEGQDATKP